MQHDQTGALLGLAQVLRHTAEDERIADAVKAILAQPPRRGNLLVDRVRPDVFGQGLVEGRVEVGDVPHVDELLHAGADDLEGGVVVPACIVRENRSQLEDICVHTAEQDPQSSSDDDTTRR